MCESDELGVDDFMLNVRHLDEENVPASNTVNLEEVEKETIRKAIQQNFGNLSSAAKELGMGRSTLYRKMKKYGL